MTGRSSGTASYAQHYRDRLMALRQKADLLEFREEEAGLSPEELRELESARMEIGRIAIMLRRAIARSGFGDEQKAVAHMYFVIGASVGDLADRFEMSRSHVQYLTTNWKNAAKALDETIRESMSAEEIASVEVTRWPKDEAKAPAEDGDAP